MMSRVHTDRHARTALLALAVAFLVTPLSKGEVSDDLATPVVIKPMNAQLTLSSSALTMQAWKALEEKQFTLVMKWANECIKRYRSQALRQQAALNDFAPDQKALQYWALNDVATCLFIKGRALRWQGRKDEAREIFSDIMEHYTYAKCWDKNGWFWKVSRAAKDQIDCIELGIDFGDYTSQTLTAKAWESLDAKKFRHVELFADKCIELYGEEARKMQATMSGYAPKGQEFNYWALNDVATCLFIKARALQEQKQKEEARVLLHDILESYSYAQCWDPRGWFWKLSRGAQDYARGNPRN
jgi:tetratricopeptide (TPR) repeat protein